MEKEAKVRFEGRIPRPVPDVFDAIVNPDRLSKYFVTRASGPLVAGKTTTWYFDDAGAELNILVLQLEQDKRIVFQWNASGTKAQVEIDLREVGGETEVRVREGSWTLDKRGMIQALGQMSGWTDFFDSLKAYLLFNVDMRRGVALEDPIRTEQSEMPKVDDETPMPTPLPVGRSRTFVWSAAGLAAGLALGAGGMLFVPHFFPVTVPVDLTSQTAGVGESAGVDEMQPTSSEAAGLSSSTDDVSGSSTDAQ